MPFHCDYFAGGTTGDILTTEIIVATVVVVAAVVIVGGIIGGILVWLYKR